ncbi:Uncharacterised protein [Sphingobacterium thalpophilum]|uniref:Uncharacterized protein n=1 Tax=Sphingobacterium thalpophilum TaxID=259 RepID=A0A4U9VIC4_9SPHI|nr:Uncharacterised protein [Sphingobacterium thalpophilum]
MKEVGENFRRNRGPGMGKNFQELTDSRKLGYINLFYFSKSAL